MLMETALIKLSKVQKQKERKEWKQDGEHWGRRRFLVSRRRMIMGGVCDQNPLYMYETDKN